MITFKIESLDRNQFSFFSSISQFVDCSICSFTLVLFMTEQEVYLVNAGNLRKALLLIHFISLE